MKNTICAVLSFLFIVSAVFGGGGRDLDADAYSDLDEVVMVSSGGGMNIESYMGMLLMFADELSSPMSRGRRLSISRWNTATV